MIRPRDRVDAVLADAGPALLGFFLRRVEPAEDAADLVSETLAAAWKASRKRGLEGRRRVAAWGDRHGVHRRDLSRSHSPTARP